MTTDQKQPRSQHRSLAALFDPQSIVVIGSNLRGEVWGRQLLKNVRLFPGDVYLVDPSPAKEAGIPNYSTLKHIQKVPNLALITVNPDAIPNAIAECVDHKIAAAVILSTVQAESESAKACEQSIHAHRGRLAILGPNSLGLIRPLRDLNASYCSQTALPGKIAFASQSAALGAAILDWSLQEKIGFSAFVSGGAMHGVSWSDLLDYFGGDTSSRSILLYLESFGEVRSFLSAAREVAWSKPIIVMKPDRTINRLTADRDACIREQAINAVFRRAGVLRVRTLHDLFDSAKVLATQPAPTGPRLTIITNSNSAGQQALQELLEQGGEPAPTDLESWISVRELAQQNQAPQSPIDLGDQADATRFRQAIEVLAKDSHTDGLLVILSPHPSSDPTAIAEALIDSPTSMRRPCLANWLGGQRVAKARAKLSAAGIPSFRYPDSAARAFAYIWKYGQNLRHLYETPALPAAAGSLLSTSQDRLEPIKSAHADGRTHLTQAEVTHLFSEFRIPEPASRLALNEEAVRRLWPSAGRELRLCSLVDAELGPILVFGSVDPLTHELDDFVVGLPPLNATLAKRMLEQTQVYRSLQRLAGGKMADVETLQLFLVRFSQLIAEAGRIKEARLTLWLTATNSIAVEDTSIVFQPPDLTEHDLPRPAIRPYPLQYVSHWKLPEDIEITVRPICPEDEPAMVAFHGTLSDRSVYFRYFGTLNLQRRVEHERLARLCFVDYDREIALVADQFESNRHHILGVARLIKSRFATEGEFAVVVSDQHQGRGLGCYLLGQLIEVAAGEKLERLTGLILRENNAMLRVCRKLGFQVAYDDREQLYRAVLRL